MMTPLVLSEGGCFKVTLCLMPGSNTKVLCARTPGSWIGNAFNNRRDVAW